MVLRAMISRRTAIGSESPSTSAGSVSKGATFPLGEAAPGRLIESLDDLSPATKARLLAGTALEFLGLPEDHFATSKAGNESSEESHP